MKFGVSERRIYLAIWSVAYTQVAHDAETPLAHY